MEQYNIELEEIQPLQNSNIQQENIYNFFSLACFKSIFYYHIFLLLSLSICVSVAIYTKGIIFVILSAIIPSTLIIEYSRNFYDKYITRCQMLVTSIETILYMQFITIFTDLIDRHLLGNNNILNILIISFISAGLIEETVKTLPLLRIANKQFITNPRALWVYGICSGASFACFENIFYVLMGGIQTALIRSILSVPLHCCTGLIIGMNLSVYKFNNIEYQGLYKIFYSNILILPVFIHGLFDFLLMVGEITESEIFFYIALIELICTYIYLRHYLLLLENKFSETKNIHIMIEEREIDPPCKWFIL